MQLVPTKELVAHSFFYLDNLLLNYIITIMQERRSNRPINRDHYFTEAGKSFGIKVSGYKRDASAFVSAGIDPVQFAREVASRAIADASAHKNDEQHVRIAASAAKKAARIIDRATGQKGGRYEESPSWRFTVGWPKNIEVTHASRQHAPHHDFSWKPTVTDSSDGQRTMRYW